MTDAQANQLMTLLPFPLPGRIYRSPMPFGIKYDPDGVLLHEYIENQISLIVPLASIEECEEKAHMNLHELYGEERFDVVSLPIDDGSVPSLPALAYVVNTVIEHAQSGRNVAVHCSAGQGRTGTFMACLARQLLGLSGDEAIRWVRQYIPGAVETELQEQIVREYIVE